MNYSINSTFEPLKEKKLKYTYKFRLYPDENQVKYLNVQFGYSRFVYNQILSLSLQAYKELGYSWNKNEAIKTLRFLKKEYEFLKEAFSQILQQSIIDLDKAFQGFFEKRTGFPKFKRKKSRQAVRFPQFFKIERKSRKRSLLFLPKLSSPIKMKTHREIVGEIRSVTVVKEPDGKYYACVLVEREFHPKEPTKSPSRIRFGCKGFSSPCRQSR